MHNCFNFEKLCSVVTSVVGNSMYVYFPWGG